MGAGAAPGVQCYTLPRHGPCGSTGDSTCTFPGIIALKGLITPASLHSEQGQNYKHPQNLWDSASLPQWFVQRQDAYKKRRTTKMISPNAMAAKYCNRLLYGHVCSECNMQIKSLVVITFQFSYFLFFRLCQNKCDTGFKIAKSI